MNDRERSIAYGEGYETGYDEARADLLTKLRFKIRRRDLTSVKAIKEWVDGRIEKAREFGRWPEGWD